jgi:acetolactate synthase-1/2/3 large subunit
MSGVRRLAGGRALAEMLQAHGVGPMFGMGGFQLLPFYDAVRDLGMTHHLIDDERAGCFAADAYARVTQRPGVCDATLGPGATNLVTALVESLNASIPLVVIVGDTHRTHSWKNMTQEARQLEILRPAVKEVLRVEVGERIPELVRRAFAVATSGRPGPVVLAVPEDVSHGEFEYAVDDLVADEATTRAPAYRARPDVAGVEHAVALVSSAERPLVLAGGGIHLSGAWEALLALVEEQRMPVAHTLSGKGAIPCTHPLSVGLFGRYDRIANDLIAASDALLVVGCKLGEVATKRYTVPPPGVPIIQLDSSPEELGRTTRIAHGLWCDARAGLEDLRAALADTTHPDRAAWVDGAAQRRRRWADDVAAKYGSDESPVHMARLIADVRAALPEDGILIADGGFASHWSGLLFDTLKSGRTFITDRGFASIGYGLPAALGAQLAAPDSPVVGLTGDGGLNMSVGGLETARRAGAGFTLVVVNNAASGYVKALQHAVYGAGKYQSSDLIELDYAQIARAFGCHGVRVEDPGDLAPALREAIALRDTPCVIDVVVTRDPGQMLPGVDSRTAVIKPGDRPA